MHSKLVIVDKNHVDKGLGSYLAEYVDDSTVAQAVAIGIIVLMSIFYISNFWLIRQTKRLVEFIKSQKETIVVSESIL